MTNELNICHVYYGINRKDGTKLRSEQIMFTPEDKDKDIAQNIMLQLARKHNDEHDIYDMSTLDYVITVITKINLKTKSRIITNHKLEEQNNDKK